MGVNTRIFIVTFFSIVLTIISACDGSSGSGEDTNPDDFEFSDETGVPLAEYVESDSIEVEGINTETEISIEGGEYSINGGEYTDDAGEVTEGQFIQVRIFSEDTIETESEATLTIGDKEDTFTITTTSALLLAEDAFKAITFTWPSVDGADYYRLLEKPTADQDFSQLGRQLASTAIGVTIEKPIHRLDWFNAEYMLETCTVAECSFTDSISVFNYMRRAIGYIKSTNSESHDRFSKLVISADGETLAVGAPGEDSDAQGVDGDDGNNSASGAGAVFVYVKEQGNWRFQSYLKASNSGAGDAFGSALAISSDGNTLAIGAPFEDSDANSIDGDQRNDDRENSGAVYVFQRSGDTWIQQNYIKSSHPDAGDEFGSQLALSSFGSTLAVSAPKEDSQGTVFAVDPTDNSAEDAGAVLIFSQIADNWQQLAYLKANNPDGGDNFGESIDISANGNRLVVGAVNEQSNAFGIDSDDGDNSLTFAGAAYIFDRDEDTWSYSHYLKPSNTHENMRFSSSVAISEDASTIIVGAVGDASNDIGVDGDSSNRENPDSGAAFIFSNSEGIWTQDAYLKSSNGDAGDLFGRSVDVNSAGDLIAVGAPGESGSSEGVSGNEDSNDMGDAGAVYVFEKLEGAWSQLKYVKAANADSGDSFGQYVSLDASGDTLAIGAPEEQSSSTRFENIQTDNSLTSAGAVYLY